MDTIKQNTPRELVDIDLTNETVKLHPTSRPYPRVWFSTKLLFGNEIVLGLIMWHSLWIVIGYKDGLSAVWV